MDNYKGKKIMIVSNTAWSLWNFRIGLARRLQSLGADVVLVAPDDVYAQKFSHEFQFISIRNLDRKGTNPFKDFALFLEFWQIYRRHKPDAVINFTIKPNIYSSMAAGMLRIQVMSVLTGLGYVFIKDNFLAKLVTLLYKVAFHFDKKVIFQNEDDSILFLEKNILSTDKRRIIHGSGVDTEKFKPDFCDHKSPDDGITFLMVTRLLWFKGIGEFIDAARRVKEKYPEAKFLLLGPIDHDNPSGISESELKVWEKEGVIRYLGTSEDVRPDICRSDVVVLPSYKEGVPKSLLEAMAMGKPIITTDTPGCRDLVAPDEANGFLVPAKDAEALAAAMMKMIEMSKETRARMGEQGRAIVLKTFDERIIISEYLQAIQELFFA